MPKDKFEFIRFVEETPASGGRIWWTCKNKKSDTDLGYVQWYSQWKQYIFTQSEGGVIFSAGCLRDIASFLDAATKGE